MGLPVTFDSEPTLRLALSLALALVLHGMAMYFLRFPSSPAVDGRKAVLEVVLRAAEAPSSADFPDVRQAASNTPLRIPERVRRTRSAEPPPPSDESVQAVPSPVREVQPAISISQLLESARRIIRDEAKNTERGAVMGNEHTADTVEARLAKALRTPSVGEKRLDNGLVKITTVFGTTYCLKAPPDSLRGGLVDPISIPTTCP
ncbi:MAG: hypothetical protein ACYCTW_11000 [Sulfuricella sp.]